MATIQRRISKTGTISYRARVRIKGFPPQTATFQKKSLAKQWAEQTETGIREGRYLRTSQAQRRTLGELVDLYLVEAMPGKPASIRVQRAQLLWWKAQLGGYCLAHVTPELVASRKKVLSRGLTPKGTRRAAGTVNRYLAALSHAFTFAIREVGWTGTNPVRSVSREREPRGRVRFLSDYERDQLLASCRSSSERRLYPLVVLALSTGARQSELLGLCWNDIDSSRGLAIIHHTKNGERRAVPVTGYAAELLREMRKVRRMDTDLVFPAPGGKATFPRKAWERALRKARIDDFRFHDLRHTAASYLAMSGATLAEIAEVLGHKTLAVVKRYSHLSDQHTTKVVSRMNERMFGFRGNVRQRPNTGDYRAV